MLNSSTEKNQDQWAEVPERQRKALPLSPGLDYLYPPPPGVGPTLTHSRRLNSVLSPDETHATENLY